MADDEKPAKPADTDLEKFRSYLLVCAQVSMGDWLQGRVSPSDVVQDVLLEAHRGRDRYRGDGSGGKLAWLRQILVNRVRRAARDLQRKKRDRRQEVSLEALLERTSLVIARTLPNGGPTPSQELARQEHILRVCDALLALPESQRRAVMLRYLEECSQAEVADALGTTTTAAAGLIHRGLKALRERLGASR